MKDLPKFKPRDPEAVLEYISEVLTSKDRPLETALIELIVHDDGHYRALFNPSYFMLQPGHGEPTKSQWNTLKKKMKRHDPGVFVFKEHGEIEGKDLPGGRGYYVDFGFPA